MLFQVHSDISKGEKDFFEMNPGALAIEEFSSLTSQQMFAVTLIADRDYDSPLRTLPEKTRREKAVEIAGYKREPDGKRLDKNARNIVDGKVDSVEKAIKKYYDIQYDEEREILDATNSQIRDALALMKVDKMEACKVTKTQRIGKTKDQPASVVTTEYTDMAMVAKLTSDAMKIAIPLRELKNTRDILQKDFEKSAPLDKLMTNTAVDLVEEDMSEKDFLDDAHLSTLDKVMEKQRKIENDD